MSEYTTDVTRTKGGYYCRILLQDKPLVQTKVSCRKGSRSEIRKR